MLEAGPDVTVGRSPKSSLSATTVPTICACCGHGNNQKNLPIVDWRPFPGSSPTINSASRFHLPQQLTSVGCRCAISGTSFFANNDSTWFHSSPQFGMFFAASIKWNLEPASLNDAPTRYFWKTQIRSYIRRPDGWGNHPQAFSVFFPSCCCAWQSGKWEVGLSAM